MPDVPKSLLSARDQRKLIPFVGAGVSMAVRRKQDGERAFPGWLGLLEEAAERLLHEQRPEHRLVSAFLQLDTPDTTQAARYAQQGLGPGWTRFLRRRFDPPLDTIDESSLELARAVWSVGSKLVITTNYDHVLRWSHTNSADLTEWPISAPDGLVEALRGPLERPTVWHLHGSVNDPSQIVLSPDGYAQLYPSEAGGGIRLHQLALEALRHLMTAQQLLFIGFSLSDVYLVRQLEWVRDTFKGCGGPHYVLTRRRDVAGMAANVKGLGVEFVCVDEFEQMPEFLRALAPVEPPLVAETRSNPNLAVGDTLGDRYELLEQAGDGGFATVWKARDCAAKREVAVKVLHAQWWDNETRVERFCRGARAMARLEHHAVVGILAAPELVGHHYFFVMRWLPGKDLRAAVVSGALERDAALSAVADALEGLAHAHASGLVHRDVKPGNILLDVDGHGSIADFDLVGGADTTQGTRTAAGMGTVTYAAPELIDDAANADSRADVYGAAMCVLFALTGKDPPWLVLLIKRGWFDAVSCGLRLRSALQGALAIDKNERDVSCEQLAAAIRAELRGDPDWPAWASGGGEDVFGEWASFRVGEVEQRMRWIEPGTFMMGSPPDEAGRYDPEGPQHQVTLTQGYWMAETACTQALWETVMGANPCRFKSPGRPVESVSWEDVQVFLERLEQRVPGVGVGLPSEAQWEYACRAGTTTATYAGAIELLGENHAPVLDEIAWYGGNSGVDFDLVDGHESSVWPEKQYPHTRAGTRVVGQKQPNQWGLHDMLGNVWEWCSDAGGLYDASPVSDPAGPSGQRRVYRGGSWGSTARYVRAAGRYRYVPGARYGYLGFRLVRGQK